MSKQVLLQQLGCIDREKKKEIILVMNSAGVLQKVKAACILIIQPEDVAFTLHYFDKQRISSKVLYQDEQKNVILFYHEKQLEQHIHQEKVKYYLKDCLYTDGSLENCLEQFAARLCSYYKGEAAFPHEMGVFLEYPLEDIDAFILHKGKNYLMSGYWKVYGNLEDAKRTFEILDKAKERAIDEWFLKNQTLEAAG